MKVSAEALRQIDEDPVSEFWEQAPAFVRTITPKTTFVEELRRALTTAGAVAGRDRRR